MCIPHILGWRKEGKQWEEGKREGGGKVVNIRDEREDLTTDSTGKVNKGIVE